MTITNIADPIILAIPIHECGEPLIDLKNQTVIAYGPAPEVPETESDYTKMRVGVYRRLCQAQGLLPNGWRFRLYEGLRSRAVQRLLFNSEFEKVQAMHPELIGADLFYRTTQLISPVVNLDGSENVAPHETGGAIDVEIIDAKGELVDMGMALIDWRVVPATLCLTECSIISDTARRHRELLHQVMSQVGFINYPTEWWHFSFGDRYWAHFAGHKTALYGPVTADIEVLQSGQQMAKTSSEH